MSYHLIAGYLACLFLLITPLVTNAVQPMISDDATNAAQHEFDFYFYSTLTSTPTTTWGTAPALEIDYGLTSTLELHLAIPYLTIVPKGLGRAFGLSDIETGFKALLVKESTYLPAIAFEPLMELPTGNVKRNLGNGRAWYKFPIWLEKNWKRYKTYGGGGYIYNGAPGMVNAYFLGWVFQYNYSEQLQLSAEIYTQTALARSFGLIQDQGGFTLLNLGLNYQIYPRLALQFAAAHNIAGVQQWSSYLGLYYDVVV